MAATVKPFGTWSSPLSSADLVSSAVRLYHPSYDQGRIHWVESRPLEGGRFVLVTRDEDGAARDALPATFSVRSLVHEYGGRAYCAREGVIFFVNYDDQRVYRLDPGGTPFPLTPEPPSPRAWRYAELVATPDGDHLIGVRERHEPSGVVNDLVLLDGRGRAAPRQLAGGHDFYAAPTLSADGRRLAYLTWDHPRMPWDGTELHVAELDERYGVLATSTLAGGPEESVLQPGFTERGSLVFLSDRSGWWNLYLDEGRGPSSLAPREAEFAGPLWILGTTWYATPSDGVLVATWAERTAHLGVLGADGVLREVPTPYDAIDDLVVADGRALFLAGSASRPTAIVEMDLASGAIATIKESRPTTLAAGYLASPEFFDFPTTGGLVAHAYFYPPTNQDFAAPEGERAPLIVASHSGPTRRASTVLRDDVQFWTSRGFAFVDVDYGGSTGYGRAYRERLKGQWGVVDVDDCVNAARHLVKRGRADPARLLIRGSSASGYTALCALTFRDDFAAGASYYGVGDPHALARDSHKFESHYTDQLIGTWPAARDLYRARSPLEHAERLRTPTIIFQGLDDRIVPPTQSEALVAALEANGVPYAYLTFEGEGHVFRRAETITRATDAELAFYAMVLGLVPSGQHVELEVHHREALTARRATGPSATN